MDKIIQINGMQHISTPKFPLTLGMVTEEDGDLICQAGARWEDINQALRSKNIPLFFPVRLMLLPLQFSHSHPTSDRSWTWCRMSLPPPRKYCSTYLCYE